MEWGDEVTDSDAMIIGGRVVVEGEVQCGENMVLMGVGMHLHLETLPWLDDMMVNLDCMWWIMEYLVK